MMTPEERKLMYYEQAFRTLSIEMVSMKDNAHQRIEDMFHIDYPKAKDDPVIKAFLDGQMCEINFVAEMMELMLNVIITTEENIERVDKENEQKSIK